jgi:hypothetical protein
MMVQAITGEMSAGTAGGEWRGQPTHERVSSHRHPVAPSVAPDRVALDAPCRCPNCGTAVDPFETLAIKRGALIVTREPYAVTWRGRPVRLSPTETHILATVAVRGRASFAAIDEALLEFGASPGIRAVLMLRIRRKFLAMGASDPFERVGNAGVRLVIDADEDASRSTIIGLRATVSVPGMSGASALR